MKSHVLLENGSQWLGRTLAIVMLMVAPGFLGAWLDKQFGTDFLTPIGFAGGVVVGTTALIIVAKQFSPPVRGKALPSDIKDDDITDDSTGSELDTNDASSPERSK